ncbi:MAG: hypothetical protein WCO52_01645 [bacterium]
MSTLIDPYRWSGGLLTAGDSISLSPGLRVEKGELVDDATLARHKLHVRAGKALVSLERISSVSEWLTDLDSYNISEKESRQILLFLGTIGGISIRRSLTQQGEMFMRKASLLYLGAPPLQVAVRRSATIKGISSSVFQAMLLLWLVTPAMALLLSLVLPTAAIPWLLPSLPVLFMGLVAHEYAHVIILRRYHPAICVLRRGMRLAILHPPLDMWVEAVTGLVGPLAGAGVSILTSMLVSRASALPGVLFAGQAIALLHLASLLPFYGDGRSLLTLFKRTAHVTSVS